MCLCPLFPHPELACVISEAKPQASGNEQARAPFCWANAFRRNLLFCNDPFVIVGSERHMVQPRVVSPCSGALCSARAPSGC